ncbi:cilia- and flagella-associated protein 251-like [Cimex lectularius]|uniref:Cilia- and flagella-associated protein 251 n=1 Tax=Cimex lectularius TaxID=79782 RepID=A0A8I6R832_CIMLE|nr:cilia- and flagella-associated protein 251-like [Cimex lectularius]
MMNLVQDVKPFPERSFVINLIKAAHQGQGEPNYFLKKETGHWNVKFTTPFCHYWTFGMNKNAPIQNLTTPNEPLLLFASGHFPILYNYEYETMVSLKGHRNKIRTTACDGTGQWLATADNGPGNTIIVWNVEQCIPVYTIFEFEHKAGAKNVYLSECGKYLIVHLIGIKKQEILLYEWALPNNTLKATLVLDPNFGEVVDVAFCKEVSEYLMVTSKTNVIFVTYIPGTKTLTYHNTTFTRDDKVGGFTCSTYHTGSHLSLTATDTGNVIVWSDLDYFEGSDPIEMTNEKDVITYVNLVDDRINAINSIDGYIAVGTNKGRILFYNSALRIVYWFQHKELDSILQVSFHRRPRENNDVDPDYHRRMVNTMFIMGKLCVKKRRDISDWAKLEEDYNKENSKFTVRDFIVKTTSGQVAYINYSKQTIEYLLEYFIHNATAMDPHPAGTYICIGTSSLTVCLIDYMENQTMITKQPVILYAKLSKKSAKVYVSSLKYSANGVYLACGLSNGELHILHPLLLTSTIGTSYHYENFPITMIKFSLDSVFVGYCDMNCTFFLLKLEANAHPAIIGNIKSHSKEITEILFKTTDFENMCYTIAKDKYIVEYNLEDCLAKRNLIIQRRIRVEQRCHPMCMAVNPTNSNLIIMGNSNSKLRLIETTEMTYVSTKQGPLLDQPLDTIMVLNNTTESEYLVFSAGNQMGIIKFPLDGNPFKWIALHMGEGPKIDFAIDKDSTFVFSLSRSEKNVQMWRIMPGILDVLEMQGGSGISPYLKLLGPNHTTMLNELRDYFHYAQLLHEGEYNLQPRSSSNTISLCEVPDVLRAVGCFPTIFELDMLMHDSEFATEIKDKKPELKELSIEDFIKILINYRDSSDVSEEELKAAFQTALELQTDKHGAASGSLTREDFVNMLVEWGEPFTFCEAYNYLKTLLKPATITKKVYEEKKKQEVLECDFLPEYITYEYLTREILGRKDADEIMAAIDEENKLDEEIIKIKEKESDKEMEETKQDYDLRMSMKKIKKAAEMRKNMNKN